MKIRLPGVRLRRGNVAGDSGDARFSASFHGTAAGLAENQRSNTQTDHVNSAGRSAETLRTLIDEMNPSCLFCDKPVIKNAQNAVMVRRMSNGSIGIAPGGSVVHGECFRRQFLSRNW